MTTTTAYDRLLRHIREISTARSIRALLDWDQETCMPKRAAADRAGQLAWIAGRAHELQTDPAMGKLLQEAENEPEVHEEPRAVIKPTERQANLREARRSFDRAIKLPTALVEDIARASSLAKDAWQSARKNSQFSAFAPHLSRMLELKRQVADRIGYDTEPYDALMDEYEPGARAADVQQVFDGLRAELVPLVAAIRTSPRKPDAGVLSRHCPRDAQAAFNRRIAEAMGFDFDAGRIDTSTHPFCSGTTPSDVRLTTRYDEEYMPMSLFGIMHEAGHGLYEQGFQAAHTGTPMADAVSLGIHESQSRMWENMIGRSREFWEHFHAPLRVQFPSLADVSLDAWHFAINTVRPSLIRVEADEVTYGLHIMLRFDLERRLIAGTLAVADVPEAWNAAMRDWLGLAPPDDARGCLQDIHWSMGAFGYFPTYALGNLYAAQFLEAARRAIPDLNDRVRQGDLRTLLDWLRVRIHMHGQRYRADELVRVVTGRPLTAHAFVAYLNHKYSALYGLN